MSATVKTTSVNKQKTAEIATNLWQITENLKGNIDAKTFSKYVLALFFYRFLSEDLAYYLSQQKISEVGELKKIQIILSKGFFIPNGELFSNVLAKAKKEPLMLTRYRLGLSNLLFSIFCSPKAPYSPYDFCLFNTEEPRMPQLFLEIYEGKFLGFEELGKEPLEKNSKLLKTMEAIEKIPIFSLVKKTYKHHISVILKIQKEIEEKIKKKL